MLAMRAVIIGGSGGKSQVPGLTVVVAYLLVVVSIAVLVLYVHHIGRSLRVSALIELVGQDTRSCSMTSTRQMRRSWPPSRSAAHARACSFTSTKSG